MPVDPSPGIEIATGRLSAGAVAVVRVTGEEALSEAYTYRAELVSAEPFAAMEEALFGARATLTFTSATSARRVSGVVRSIESMGVRDTPSGLMTAFAIELVPRLSLARERVTYRVFQGATAAEMAKEIFDAWEVPHRFALHEARAPWEYCVQYGESDYDFVRRVLAADGIYFTFAQPTEEALARGLSEIVVLGDTHDAHEVPEQRWFEEGDPGPVEPGKQGDLARDPSGVPVLRARTEGALGEAGAEQVMDFRLRRTLAPGAVVLRDYLPGNARFDLAHGARSAERAAPIDRVYTFLPARRMTGDARVDTAHARRDLERVRGGARVHEGRSNSRALAVGRRFRVEETSPPELEGELVVVRLSCEAHDPRLSMGREAMFEARIEARRADEPLRPTLAPPRPSPTLDTAVVVGPPGAETFTDAMGRVKVQFRWDLERAASEHSSAWLRVAQPWSGAGFGAAFLPRVGMEVLVSYVGGDVNRPVILGCVQNSDNPGPFAMPGDAAKSGVVSRSTPGGAGGNQLVLDDAADNERILVHAHRDMETRVRREQRTVVGGNQVIEIGGARGLSVKGARAEEIDEDDAISVGGSMRVDVAGARALRVGGQASATYEAGLGVEVRGASTLRLGGDAEARVDGRLHVGLERDAVLRSEEHTVLVVGAHAAPRALLVHVEGTSVSEATKTLEIGSEEAIRLRVGDSSILVTKDAIQLSAKKVRLDAQTIEIVGDAVQVKGAELARIEGKRAFLLSEGASVCLSSEAKIDGAEVKLKSPPDATDGPEAKPRSPPPTKIVLADPSGNPLPGERFVVKLADGTERSGVLDENGEAVLPDLEGSAKIVFPDLPGLLGS